MLTGQALDRVLARLMPVDLHQTYVRRVNLAALLGLKKLPTRKSKEILIQPPQFLRCSMREYRFNPPGILNIYLGEGESVATAETKQHPGLRGFDCVPAAPDTIYHIEVKVSAILDLTSPKVQKALKTTPRELTANWRLESARAPTQLLGKAVFESNRFEGIRYISAPLSKTGVEGFCLVLFRDRKKATSRVKLVDSNSIWSDSW